MHSKGKKKSNKLLGQIHQERKDLKGMKKI